MSEGEPTIGHNGINGDKLQAFVERIERLNDDKMAVLADLSVVFKEAKDAGFDKAIIREIVKLRKMDEAERREKQDLLELYMHALGMLADTDLGRAAARSEFGGQQTEDAVKAAEGAHADAGAVAGA